MNSHMKAFLVTAVTSTGCLFAVVFRDIIWVSIVAGAVVYLFNTWIIEKETT